jgi:hypothetical protein
MTTIQLQAVDSRLHLPATEADAEGFILMFFYPAGDLDTCRWPMVQADHEESNERACAEYRLAVALFDAREMGRLPEGAFVTLPDGKPFDFDAVAARENPHAYATQPMEW